MNHEFISVSSVPPWLFRSPTTLPGGCASLLAEDLRGVHQRDVREGLRKISELAFVFAVVFLGEKTQIVAQT